MFKCICKFATILSPARTLMLVSDWLAARRFAATSRDHRLLFHGLQLSAATPLRLITGPSGIASELNWSQLYAICRGGQSSKVIDLLARRCLPLGYHSAASDACAVVQISSSKRQYERQASLKAASLDGDFSVVRRFCNLSAILLFSSPNSIKVR